MPRFTKDEALAIKDRHSLALLKTPGVYGVGVKADDAGNHRLVIMADAGIEKARLPREIEGLPVSIEETERFRPQ
jgi:hypothetical protein